jgi:hypothetical protein
MWNDLTPYKNIFVAQGFYELFLKGKLDLQFVDYKYFLKKVAPEMSGSPYNSHKNIVIFEIIYNGHSSMCVYDTNDLYYKIPNSLLKWCDIIYYKSNFQEKYIETGELLTGEYWDTCKFRSECLPEKLDLQSSYKLRPCSFSMELYPSLNENMRYMHRMEGLWHKTKKNYDLFYVERYWSGRSGVKKNIIAEISRKQLRLIGGIVQTDEPLPKDLLPYKFDAVPVDKYLEIASTAKVSVMSRGLDGCLSFKPMNFLMIGSPFIALELKSNLYKEILPDVNYISLKDDLSNISDVLERIKDESFLTKMAENNLNLWKQYIKPVATAKYLIKSAFKEEIKI